MWGTTGEVAMPCGSKSGVRELSSISVYHIYVLITSDIVCYTVK
jgi:hypothetical protein